MVICPKKVYMLFLFTAITILFGCKTGGKEEKQSIINSTVKSIKYSVNDTQLIDWNISPELKPDVLTVECVKEKNLVSFYTDIDSVTFTLTQGDTLNFIILLNKKDSAFTRIIGLPKNANFSDDYIQQHKGKFEVDIPEVQELANILIAISKIGQLDSNMVDMTTPYHASVLSTFLKYRNHPIIDTINKNIIASDQNSYWYYYALKMNACGYVFDKDDHIINKVIVRKMGFNYPEDPFIKNKKLIEDFAKQSKFREFYKNNKTYYDSLIVFYRQINPIDNMQKWLEKKFNFSYGNYCVLFSPLVGGAHATTQFSDNNFDQTFMFVCRAEIDSKYNKEMNEMLNSKVVFTEIDHNFVNPISDKNLESINKVFSKRSAWVKEGAGTEAYSTPYTVFNEYMTWSVFSLYCFDNFPEKDAKQFISKMENQMIVSRGFRQFKSFNQQLIKIYKDEPNITISELYRKILNWSSEQNQ